MAIWIKKVILLIFILIIALVYVLFFELGLREYFAVRLSINKLTKSEILQIDKKFFSWGENNLYQGTFSGIWFNKLWIWGKKGLYSFDTDKYSVYYLYPICEAESSTNKTKTHISQEVYFNLNEWKTKINQGDYVSIMVSPNETTIKNLNVRYVFGYDWQVYMPNFEINKKCQK